MITPTAKDAEHKAWMFRLLSALFDDAFLSTVLYFKGGTCAAMRGFLDRFSVDLDFDYISEKEEIKKVQEKMEEIFQKLGLEIKDKSRNVPQYFLKYPTSASGRNTLKIDICFPVPQFNQYESAQLEEIDRIVNCQTRETMVANKLVALINRFEKNGRIAGRDVYDVHYFFWNGFRYDAKIIEDIRKCSIEKFFEDLVVFVEDKITQEIIDQDLNMLLSNDNFQMIRKILKQETLMMLRDELARIKNGKL
ncbi:MAG: nucleotidyl transferase AbiEii/AbiGii toxin family protein [bacterium]|nr:nucleotidyl transferase AbiEii/AbiGii toxin family protein [bacterium]